SAHRSWTQPVRAQASMMTTAGRSLVSSRCISLRVVSKVVKRKVPGASPREQATLLYLPRSMARIVSAAVVLAVVVIVQAPGGRWWGKCGNSQVTTPHGFPMNCLGGLGEHRPHDGLGHRWALGDQLVTQCRRFAVQ